MTPAKAANPPPMLKRLEERKGRFKIMLRINVRIVRVNTLTIRLVIIARLT